MEMVRCPPENTAIYFMIELFLHSKADFTSKAVTIYEVILSIITLQI